MNELIAQLEKDKGQVLKENRELKNRIKRLINFVTDEKHSQDDQSEDYLSDGEILEIVIDNLKEYA
jgi:cell division septum initiation protein DivIVA